MTAPAPRGARRASAARRGFTLVETLVATCVALTVLAAAVLIGVYSWRSFWTGVATAQALQAATLVLERVAQDLACASIDRPDLVTFDPEDLAWTFPISERGKDGAVRQRRVSYRLRPRPGKRSGLVLARDGEPLRSAHVTDLLLAWIDTAGGRLGIEVETTDATGRTRVRMRRDVTVRSLDQWAMYGRFFPRAGRAAGATVVAAADRRSGAGRLEPQ